MSTPSRKYWPKTARWGALCLLAGFIVAIAIPNFIRASLARSSNACINNLCQIEGAKQQWALENKKPANDAPTSGIVAYLKDDKLPVCPLRGTYTIGRLNEDPKRSISSSAWPNDHVLNITNSWWNNLRSAYGVLGRGAHSALK